MPAVSNHPEIDCPPDAAAALTFLQSEEGESLAVPIIARTFKIGAEKLTAAEEQIAIDLAGEYWGKPGESSFKMEPQLAFTKLATDVVLIGHAFGFGRTSATVSLEVGPLRQLVRVTGDRYWVKTLLGIDATPPEPFETLPLIYERAFGGWDRSLPDPNRHCFDRRNPVGTGFRMKGGRFEEGIRLPNIEHPKHTINSYGETPAPIGFGFTSPEWEPRLRYAGTYDATWQSERMPLLPSDFDQRFFNGASPGLIANGYLNGDELVSANGVTPEGSMMFRLPGVIAPSCQIQLVGRRDVTVHTNLDTIIINTDERWVQMICRGYLAVRSGPEDVMTLRVGTSQLRA